ncbi:MAG: class I SAM-dependent methyltransferase [Gemmataceae bacterium]
MPPSDRDHWESRYRTPGPPPWDTGQPSAELRRRLAEFAVPPGRAVELGCGTGSNAVWLAQQGFEVTGIDISPTAIDRAKQRAAAAGVAVRFLAADVTRLQDLGTPFAFFFDRGCYHAVRRAGPEPYLRELARITAPGALGVVLTGNAKEERKPGPPVVSEETIRAELGRDFDVLSLEEFRFDQDEPDPPLGWSCVLRRKSK